SPSWCIGPTSERPGGVTDALWDKVRPEAQAQVKACAAAGPKMDLKRCPRSMALTFALSRIGVRLLAEPTH
ncbi:hypothetical protein, partial [Nostocoides australiense]|nr:hypothetical protein [Tetrasphaera australiensis]